MKLFIASSILVAMAMGQVALAEPPSQASFATDAAVPIATPPGEDLAVPQLDVTSNSEAPLNLDELSDLRAGEAAGVQLTTQNLNAINTGNSVSAGDTVGSGAVNVNAGAFNGYDGIGNFVINTGHNNNLMGSVSVNVLVTPE
jgi:hypothetical protein